MNAGFLEIINHGQEEKIRLLQNKVDLYSANLEQYKQKSYNETQVRVDFVNFFFQLLGWDVLNENGLPQHLREVTHFCYSKRIWRVQGPVGISWRKD